MAFQSTHSYTILPEQSQEDDLHATRLLNVEEKPFHRVKSSLLSSSSLLKWPSPQQQQLPSPPPDTTTDPSLPNPSASLAQKRDRFRTEILLDFANLESSLLRLQLLLTTNARERARYASEKAKILSTAHAVRSNTAALRVQLQEAQRVLELRKGYDALAARLIDPRKLRTRAETGEEMRGLERGIEELEAERGEVDALWRGRWEGFCRVVEVGGGLMGVVRGVKEEREVEKGEDDNEGMEVEDGEEGGKGGEGSRIASPAPGAGGRTPIPGREMTPLPEGGDAEGEEEEESDAPPPLNKFLDIHNEDATRASSQAASPLPAAQEGEEEEEQDVEMAEEEEDPAPATLQPQAKTTAGMEASSEQVATPAEGMEEMDDQQPMAAVGVDVGDEVLAGEEAVAVVPVEREVVESEVATPVEEMDES